jgi:hypothetical protein
MFPSTILWRSLCLCPSRCRRVSFRIIQIAYMYLPPMLFCRIRLGGRPEVPPSSLVPVFAFSHSGGCLSQCAVLELCSRRRRHHSRYCQCQSTRSGIPGLAAWLEAHSSYPLRPCTACQMKIVRVSKKPREPEWTDTGFCIFFLPSSSSSLVSRTLISLFSTVDFVVIVPLVAAVSAGPVIVISVGTLHCVCFHMLLSIFPLWVILPNQSSSSPVFMSAYLAPTHSVYRLSLSSLSITSGRSLP